MHEIRVAFAGGRAREGPVTLSQRNMLWSMRHQATDGHNFNLSLVVPLPAGTAVDTVVHAVRLVVQRHESLRTTFVAGARLRQRVAGAGEFTVEVHGAAGPGPEPVHGVTARLTATRIDPAAGPPLRVAVCAPADRPGWAVLVVSHLAVDAASVRVLRRQFESLVGSPGAGLPPDGTRQPLDQAAVEAAEPVRSRAARAVDYWRDRLLRVPQCMFAVPEQPAGRAPHRQARLRSRELALAVGAVAARTRTNRSTVVLAALSAIVGHHTGHRTCAVTAIAGNRDEPALHGFVGQLSQDALIAFDLTGPTFDRLVRQAWTASLNGYRHSRFDPVALWTAIGAVGHARGTTYTRDFVFNDLSGYAPAGSARGGAVAAPVDSAPHAEFAWLPAPDLPARFVCYVNRLDDEAELVLWADTRVLPAAGLEAVARGIERLAVAAAAHDLALGDVGALCGLAPVVRGPLWVLVDSCWLDLAQVRRLVREALPGYASGVFAVRVDGEPRLVAYLEGPGGLAPEAAHRACMALLPGRETAMAPHRYVVCDRPPSDVDAEAGWRSRAVVAEGTGREPVAAAVSRG